MLLRSKSDDCSIITCCLNCLDSYGIPFLTPGEENQIRTLFVFNFGKVIAEQCNHFNASYKLLAKQFEAEERHLKKRIVKLLRTKLPEEQFVKVTPDEWVGHNYFGIELVDRHA